jgi:hypothetical protein
LHFHPETSVQIFLLLDCDLFPDRKMQALFDASGGKINSTRYVAGVGDTPRINQQEETVKSEAGLREPLRTPVSSGWSGTDTSPRSRIGQTDNDGYPGALHFLERGYG